MLFDSPTHFAAEQMALNLFAAVTLEKVDFARGDPLRLRSLTPQLRRIPFI
jgi:hypothetical protein